MEVSRDTRHARGSSDISKGNHSSGAAEAQQAGEESEKLNKDVQLNL